MNASVYFGSSSKWGDLQRTRTIGLPPLRPTILVELTIDDAERLLEELAYQARFTLHGGDYCRRLVGTMHPLLEEARRWQICPVP